MEEYCGIYADADYFQVFSANIIAGDKLNLLPDNHSIVISEATAALLFDNGDALGKIITLDLKTDFKVTGVFARFPVNSSLNDREFILPFHSRPRDYSGPIEINGSTEVSWPGKPNQPALFVNGASWGL